MRILIVEDDRLLAAGLAMMVESAGHEVVGHAATVRAAMDLARSQVPDLTLMDIDLGLGGSGIAAARGMRKHHGLVSLSSPSIRNAPAKPPTPPLASSPSPMIATRFCAPWK